jgi:hypothetical protein
MGRVREGFCLCATILPQFEIDPTASVDFKEFLAGGRIEQPEYPDFRET